MLSCCETVRGAGDRSRLKADYAAATADADQRRDHYQRMETLVAATPSRVSNSTTQRQHAMPTAQRAESASSAPRASAGRHAR